MAVKGAIAAAAAALLVWLGLTHVAISYDGLYSLAWGQDLADSGHLDVFHPLAPLAHPLPIAVAAALTPLGPEGAYDVVSVLSALSLGFLALAAFRLTAVLTGPGRGRAGAAAGAVAVVLLLTSDRVDFFVVAGTGDVPAAALSVLAISFALESPRSRPWLPLGLLVAAGLLRPEAWVLAPVYCAWLALDGLRGRRLLGCLALAIAPIALWLGFALIASGDALSPLRGNPDAISLESLGFTTSSRSVIPEDVGNSLSAVLDGVRSVLGDELTLAALIAVIASLVLAARDPRDSRNVRVGAAAVTALLLIATSIGLSALGAIFTDRYVLTPAVILTAVSAALLFRLSPGVALAGAGLLLALVMTEALSDPTAPTLADVRAKLGFAADQRTESRDLYALTSSEAVREAVRGCDDIVVGGAGSPQEVLFAKPLVAQGLELGPERVRVLREPRSSPGSSAFVRDPEGDRGASGLTEGRWAFISPCLETGARAKDRPSA